MNTDKRWFLYEQFDLSKYDPNIQWPKISIVTPTYNYGHLIEETILSVINQEYPNLEYIIIDGGSTDNTVEIIKKYEEHITYWKSEKDTGQPSAINKGLRKCTGEIFNWLNSDDYLEKGALFYIAKAFIKNKVDAIAGKVRYFDDNGFEEIKQNNFLSDKGIMCWEKNVTFVQPGVWLKLEQVQKINGVDEDHKMRFAFDWDMMIRYLYFFPKVTYLSNLLVHYRFHPISNTISDPARYSIEEAYIIEKLNDDPKYKKLHPACSYKTSRKKWNNFLSDTSGNTNIGRLKKICKIVANLNKQPWQYGVPRMTAGAIKQILFTNKIKRNSSKS